MTSHISLNDTQLASREIELNHLLGQKYLTDDRKRDFKRELGHVRFERHIRDNEKSKKR